MKPNFNYLIELKDFALANKYVAVMYKPLGIFILCVLGFVIAWVLYVLIRRLRG